MIYMKSFTLTFQSSMQWGIAAANLVFWLLIKYQL